MWQGSRRTSHSLELIGICGRFGVPLPFRPLSLEKEERAQVWRALPDPSRLSTGTCVGGCRICALWPCDSFSKKVG